MPEFHGTVADWKRESYRLSGLGPGEVGASSPGGTAEEAFCRPSGLDLFVGPVAARKSGAVLPMEDSDLGQSVHFILHRCPSAGLNNRWFEPRDQDLFGGLNAIEHAFGIGSRVVGEVHAVSATTEAFDRGPADEIRGRFYRQQGAGFA